MTLFIIITLIATVVAEDISRRKAQEELRIERAEGCVSEDD